MKENRDKLITTVRRENGVKFTVTPIAVLETPHSSINFIYLFLCKGNIIQGIL